MNPWAPAASCAGTQTPTAALVVIVQGGSPLRVLLLLRGKTAPWAPGLWGLPGGYVKQGEAPHTAALREMAEEIGATGPRALWYAGQVRSWAIYLTYDNAQATVLADGEHDAFAWVTVEDLPHFPLAPGVLPCLRLALEKYRAQDNNSA